MDDPILAAKLAEAARAMSLGFEKKPAAEATPISIPLAQIPDISSLIKPAPQSKDSISVAEKRLQAQIAMEGEERRKAREEAVRKEKEATEKLRREEELRSREQFEKDRIEKEQLEQAARAQQQREQISRQLKQQVEEVKGSTVGLKTIRTLKFDQDNLIKSQNISLVGIAIKEEERRRQRQENTSLSSGKNLKILAFSLVLILLSIGIGSYVYYAYYAKSVPGGILPGKNIAKQSILFTETYRTLDVTDIAANDLTNSIKNEIRNPPDLRLGAIENYAFTKKNQAGTTGPLTSEEFFKIIGSEAPDNFLRTLEKEYLYGILSSAENAAFIIVRTEAYDKGLAGLLDWEHKTLAKDLYTVLTSLKPDPELLTKNFEDLLIRNKDTRILKDKDGNIRIVYGFLDDNDKTIIIAGSRQAFIEALNRFNTPRPLAQ